MDFPKTSKGTEIVHTRYSAKTSKSAAALRKEQQLQQLQQLQQQGRDKARGAGEGSGARHVFYPRCDPTHLDELVPVVPPPYSMRRYPLPNDRAQYPPEVISYLHPA
eukprot:762676-Hanusia_phi.AAC.1